ncbi:MAG TPA: NAD-dependent epimerase/dehydratase family protein [Usitatibacter sp.]|nr:NAD-dependent epimerase/dehydratase family protein [Usitatibacter sp.]
MQPGGPAIVTGAHGFVGGTLVRALRDHRPLSLAGADWRERIAATPFAGATVFHLAARVHERGGDAAGFRRDNVEKTEVLARAAARGGARCLVFASTVKVHGDETAAGAALTAGTPFAPRDAYARSKQLAEERLADVARETGLAIAIVRPPLVIGRGARANLADLLRLADTPWPLPFAAIRNRRGWVHVDDLCELLLLCAAHAGSHATAWLASHPQPFSTPALFGEARAALGRAPRLFACPPLLLERAAALAGAADRMQRLTRSLEADASPAMRELGWQPRRSLRDAIEDLVRGSRA